MKANIKRRQNQNKIPEAVAALGIENLQQFRQMQTNPMILSISLLVSNRRDTIRKCMESIKPLLDAIPSELIAVDTVGPENSDGSLDIVREYTDKILHFDWCNDFSAARNCGLKEAKGRWFMYIDDDEWFEDITEIIEFFRSGEYRSYGQAWYPVRNYNNFQGTSYVDTTAGRLTMLTPNLEFTGAVHEVFNVTYSPVKMLNCYVHHYGYVYSSPEEKLEHSRRNIGLLEKELEQHPDNLRNISQLIQEYGAMDEYEKADALCRQCMDSWKQYPGNGYIAWAMAYYVRQSIMQSKYKDAYERVKEITSTYEQINPLALSGIYFLAVHAADKLQMHEEVVSFCESYMQYCQECLDKPEEMSRYSVLELKQNIESRSICEIMCVSASHANTLKQYHKTIQFLSFSDWKGSQSINKAAVELLVEAVCQTGRYDEFFGLCNTLAENDDLYPVLVQAVEKAKNTYLTEKNRLVQIMSNLDRQDNYILLQKALLAEQSGDQEELIEHLRNCVDAGMLCLPPHLDLLRITLRNNLDPTPFMDKFSKEAWDACIKGLEQSRVEEFPALLQQSERVLKERYPLKYYSLASALRAQYILQADIPDDRLFDQLESLANLLYNNAALLYRPELLEPDGWLEIPQLYRFGLMLHKGLEARNNDDYSAWKDWLERMIRVKNIPALDPMIQRLLQLEETRRQQQPSSSSEFEFLTIQAKQNIRNLIDSGNKEDAVSLLNELKELVPNDSELGVLERMIHE